MQEINNITKSYGKRIILDKIKIDVSPGRIIGITGRNGSGKTTLMKSLIGFTKSPNKKLSNYAYLDDASIILDMPLLDIVKFYRNVYEDFDYEKFLNNCKIMNLDVLKLKELSFGQKKKFKLALILSRRVNFYLLDEPFTEIDIFSIDEIIDAIISSVDFEYSSVIIVEHNLDILERMADDVIFIKDAKTKCYSDIDLKREKSLKNIYRELENL